MHSKGLVILSSWRYLSRQTSEASSNLKKGGKSRRHIAFIFKWLSDPIRSDLVATRDSLAEGPAE